MNNVDVLDPGHTYDQLIPDDLAVDEERMDWTTD